MPLDVNLQQPVKSFKRDKIMFGKIKKLYFVGIGGAGMSGIAEILYNLGFQIKGSDCSSSKVTDYLQHLGITIFDKHDGANLKDVDVVVISSAISDDNLEVIEARRCGIPVIKRAEMLGELMRLKFSIGISGTHGKTTTTSMIGKILQQANYQPTLIVGGVVAELGTGASLGGGDYLVAEADEYDRSFLSMFPSVAVVTNIEADHLDCYDDMKDLINSFLTYMNRVPFYGAVIISADNEHLIKLKPLIARPVKTFGFSAEADFRAVDIDLKAGQTTFSVYHQENLLGEVILKVPGKFNIANALAAIATCYELEVPFVNIAEGLHAFGGVSRRFEVIGEVNGILLVDDYAHHPSEIKVTLETAKKIYDRRLIVVFQPHLYSRTRDFKKEFAQALSLADICILTDIFPAREAPIKNITSEIILDEAQKMGFENFEYVGVKANAVEKVKSIARRGDLVITMGAGSITYIKDDIRDALKEKN